MGPCGRHRTLVVQKQRRLWNLGKTWASPSVFASRGARDCLPAMETPGVLRPCPPPNAWIQQ
eukprot:8594824-Lingulodinium_polyedra.AAC.1